MKQPTSAPPDIAGYRFLRGIGAGGFADVFLYEEQDPRRHVAIKVFRGPARLDPRALGRPLTAEEEQERLQVLALATEQFRHEANTMAAVSDHPYIVAIYRSGVATDGRPFIVMEHYPNEHFGLRSRGQALAIGTALEVTIKVASAVATAHRAGILHSDIKPENILTSRSNRPGLGDFGISSASLPHLTGGAAGFSPLWAAPEVMLDPHATGSELADVYSLGATLYHLIEGRAPYADAAGNNGVDAVRHRAANDPLPPFSREVPEPIWNLLGNTIHRDPRFRPPSALDLARYLQSVQQELHFRETEIDLLEDVEQVEPSDPGPVGWPGAPVVPPAAPGVVEQPTQNVPLARDRSTPGFTSAEPATAQAPVAPPRPGTPSSPSWAPSADLTQAPGQARPAPSSSDLTSAVGTPAAPHPPAVPAAPPSPQPMPPSTPSPAAVAATPITGGANDAGDGAAEAGAGGRRLPMAVAAGVVVLLVIAAALALLGGDDAEQGGGDTTTSTGVVLVLDPDPPSNVTASRTSTTFTVSWTPPEGVEDLRDGGFRVSWSHADGEGMATGITETLPATETSTSIDELATVAGLVCVQVQTVDGSRLSIEAPRSEFEACA